jgi:hypothetical protein
LLQEWDEIREIIPHAGRLMIRLNPGTDSAAVMDKIRDTAARHHVTISKLGPATPELEDVFVAVLEEAERNSQL